MLTKNKRRRAKALPYALMNSVVNVGLPSPAIIGAAASIVREGALSS